MNARTRAGLALWFALGLTGCITTPFEKRDWFAVRTAHYEIWSSLGERETERLAVELERFRGAVSYVWGSALPEEPARTRVYAFDDRSFPRKFNYQRQRNFLLPRQRGDVIVLRTGGGWEEDAWTELKLRYARRLLWNASPGALPPWLEEGLPQLASTVAASGEGVEVGSLRDDHIRKLRESQWIPFERLLAASNLDDWSTRDREILEAESWAICHYLMVGPDPRESMSIGLARFRALLREGIAPAKAAETALGGPAQGAVYRHVLRNQFDTVRVKLRLRGPELAPRAVPLAEVRYELGELSLAIGEPAQARDYLERALAAEPGSARVLAALGAALAAQRDFAGAEERYRAALAAGAEDAQVELGYAHLLAARARDAADGERAQLVRAARERYQKSRSLAGSLPEADAGLADTYLIAGENPAEGRIALRTARAALPGDAELARLDARLALAAGDPDAARRTATLLVARARSNAELEAALALRAQIDASGASR